MPAGSFLVQKSRVGEGSLQAVNQFQFDLVALARGSTKA
jgi:hypothetical protein